MRKDWRIVDFTEGLIRIYPPICSIKRHLLFYLMISVKSV